MKALIAALLFLSAVALCDDAINSKDAEAILTLVQQLTSKNVSETQVAVHNGEGLENLKVKCGSDRISLPSDRFERWTQFAFGPTGPIATQNPGLDGKILHELAAAKVPQTNKPIDICYTDKNGRLTFMHLGFKEQGGRVHHERKICRVTYNLAPNLFIYVQTTTTYLGESNQTIVKKVPRAVKQDDIATLRKLFKTTTDVPTSETTTDEKPAEAN